MPVVAADEVEAIAAVLEDDLEAIGCVGGDGIGREMDLGEVDDVERDLVDVSGTLADCGLDDGDADCCGSAIRNVTGVVEIAGSL